MNCKLLLAIGLSFALKVSATAGDEPQKSSSLNDTIIFSPIPDSKVLIIGPDMREMQRYTKLDSIKVLFLGDLKTAKEQHTYPEGSRLTHYFVHPNGKRRIKAESADYQEPEVDLEAEKRSMSLELPPFAFLLHDLESEIDCEIYLKDPAQISLLESVSFTDAVKSLGENKKSMRKFSRIDLEKEGSSWKQKFESGNDLDYLEVTPSFGFGMIGGAWSPIIGANMSLRFTNKYGIPFLRTGLAMYGRMLADYSHKEFSNFNKVVEYEMNVMLNVAGRKASKPSWFGLQGGFYSAEKNTSLRGAFKAGFICEGFGSFNYGVDIIKLKNNQTLLGLSLRFPF
ncbi:MAG: hypothetical protein U0073_04150 [Bacteroidia bacterium]